MTSTPRSEYLKKENQRGWSCASLINKQLPPSARLYSTVHVQAQAQPSAARSGIPRSPGTGNSKVLPLQVRGLLVCMLGLYLLHPKWSGSKWLKPLAAQLTVRSTEIIPRI